MLIVRSVKKSDVDPLFDLVQKSELGLTTLKISKKEMEARIESSIFAFRQKASKPAGQPYVFVMEDLSNGRIVGTSAIYAKVGGFEPFYSYRIEKSVHQSKDLDIHKEIDTLHLLEEHDGPSEIGSLFLSPDYWGQGYGRLLSISRFLFIAEFLERFESEIIAEMRGVVNEDGKSPLWAALGSHFFQMGYPKAETLTSQSKKFIADLMPRHPIYIPLLPEAARNVIGKVHRNTEPAQAVLASEGFEFRDRVDIFDGGPSLHCESKNVRAVRESQCGTLKDIKDSSESAESQLISNAKVQFRTCIGKISWEGSEATIDPVTALQLKLKVGDRIRSVNAKAIP